MKILYVTDFSPWPIDSGGAIRSDAIIKGLARNHDVCVALANSDQEYAARFLEHTDKGVELRTLGTNPPPFYTKLTRRIFAKNRYKALTPESMKYSHRDAFLKCVEEVRPDLIWYIFLSPMWLCGTDSRTPYVFDLCDREGPKYELFLQSGGGKSLMASIDVAYISGFEAGRARKAGATLLSNPNDLGFIGSREKVFFMPNCYDFSAQPTLKTRESKRALLLGNLFYEPNIQGLEWFVSNIWQGVKAKHPDAMLDVIGRYGERAEAAVAGAKDVILHGFVENTDDITSNAAFLAVPLLVGGGTRLKILESWSKGLPVVSTNIGADGLFAKDRGNAMLADEPREFLARCIEMLDNPSVGLEVATNAYAHGKAKFDWESNYHILDEAIALAMKS